MKVMVIEADGTVSERESPGSLEWLQQAVGGPIEAVSLAETVTAYIHEDGKVIGLPRNRIATDISEDRLFPGDWIAGTMVVAGFSRATGEVRDLPKHWREHLRRLGEHLSPAARVAATSSFPTVPDLVEPALEM